MKSNRYNIIAIMALAASVSLFFSCEQEDLSPIEKEEQPQDLHLTINATWGDAPTTKTALQSDGVSVWWSPGDEVNVFYQGMAGKFTALNSEESETAVLDGTLSEQTGVTASQPTECWAIYPYNEDNSFDGTDVYLTVPYVQTAKAGSFETGLFPAIARSNTLDMSFYNVCGGVCFTVSNPSITSVVFKSCNGEALTGKVRVGFDENGLPVVKELLNGREELTINASNNRPFVPGERYYVAMLPKTLRGGLTVTCYCSGGVYYSELSCSMEIAKPITVNRSRFGRLVNIDLRSMDGARVMIAGICKAMTTQYPDYGQGYNGEGTIKTWYGNFGNDLQRCNHTGWATYWNHLIESATHNLVKFAWFYYYDRIIDPANRLLAVIDDLTGDESEKQFIKAQALTFRAHAYTMLAQIYCPRWQDSDRGSASGLVLRLVPDADSAPRITVLQTFQQIYSDLQQAINLFTASGRGRAADSFMEPDLQVACAVLTRAALIREDWETVAQYAPLARKGHPLMSQSEYMDGGFSDRNHSVPSEWIWGVYEDEVHTLYFYSFFAYQASDASSSMQRNYPLAISKELYDQIPASDARRALWLAPTDAEWAECNDAGRSTGALYNRAFSQYGSKLYSTSLVYGYMQFKFQKSFDPGGGSFNIYRSAEMYLAEAEALYYTGNHSKVKSLLNELNHNLNPSYSCDKAGEDLLTEVKLYRRIDLWGEGFDYFDYKRWNEPIVRKSKAQGSSFHERFAITINPADGNGWTFVIPQYEIDRNPALQ